MKMNLSKKESKNSIKNPLIQEDDLLQVKRHTGLGLFCRFARENCRNRLSRETE